MQAFVRLFAAGLCAAAAMSATHAQVRKVTPAPAPSASAQAARAAPNPSGLQSTLPAGISSGSGAAVSTDPVARNASPVPPGAPAPAGSTVVGGGGGGGVPTELFPGGAFGPNTSVMGAGAMVAGPSQYGGGAGGFSAVDQARSFFFADANHDGELTRAEARRLSIATQSFEEMDRNFDGVITRFEYDDSLR